MMRPLAALVLAAAVRAQGVDLVLRTTVPDGERPSIEIRVLEELRSLTLDVRGSRGTRLAKELGRQAEGAVHTISWRAAADRGEAFAGKLRITTAEGETEDMPVEFKALVLGPLEVRVDKSSVDLDARRLEVTISREAARAEVRVTGASGKIVHEGAIEFAEQPGGTPLVVTWPDVSEEVARIDLRLYDKWRHYAGVALTPWQFVLEEHVHFALDSAQIRPEERPKLDGNYADIVKAIDRYRPMGMGPIALYIAGHTDTQGTREYNRKLSDERARAIARYFRRKGLAVAIHFHGFGEEAPAVPTPDETDEPRNRRVEYIVDDEPPRGVSWHRLR